jgi:hypothetical protein
MERGKEGNAQNSFGGDRKATDISFFVKGLLQLLILKEQFSPLTKFTVIL